MRLEEFRKAQSGGREPDRQDRQLPTATATTTTDHKGRLFQVVLLLEGERRRSLHCLLFFSSFPPIRTCETRRGTGRKEGRRRRNKKERGGKSPRVLPLFRCVLGGVARVGDLAHFTHQLFHPSDNEPRFKFVVVANFCVLPTPHYFARSGRGKNTKGALRSTEWRAAAS